MEEKAQSVSEGNKLAYSIVYPTTPIEAFGNSTLMNNQMVDNKMEVELLSAVVPTPTPTPALMRSSSLGNKTFSTRSRLVDLDDDDDDETELISNARIPTLDEAIEDELKHARHLNPNLDHKKLRRTVSNRLSAQRARLKRSQYITELEAKITELKGNIALMSPMIDNQKDKQKLLQTENSMLEQELNTCMMQSNICNMEIEENKLEVKRLQELEKMQKEEDININSSFFSRFQNAVIEGGSINTNRSHYINQRQIIWGRNQFPNSNDLNRFHPGPNHFPF